MLQLEQLIKRNEEISNERLELFRNVLKQVEEIVLEKIEQFSEHGRIIPFGSYQLKVMDSESDLDVVMVGSSKLKSEFVFRTLESVLKHREEVEYVLWIKEAYVPVLKFTFNGVHVDVLFSNLIHSTLQESLNLYDDDCVAMCVDDPSQRALNGPRVSMKIVSMIPDSDIFRDFLRIIKMWSKKRGVYGNILGYPGGIAYAILCAKIHILSPNDNVENLLKSFFRIFSTWDWPLPVELCAREQKNFGYAVWKEESSPSDLFPVITPCYPASNACYNVGKSTLSVLQEEFFRAHQILDLIDVDDFSTRLQLLLEDTKFFIQYRQFICIEVSSSDSLKHHKKWSQYIESKLRYLLPKLEEFENLAIHPFPMPFHEKRDDDYISSYYIGFKYLRRSDESGKVRVDITKPIKEWESSMEEWKNKNQKMTLNVLTLHRRNIPENVCSMEKKKDLAIEREKWKKRIQSQKDKNISLSPAIES